MTEDKPSGVRRLRDWLEIASFAAVIVGIVVGFADHFANQRKEARDAKEALYDGLDAEYRDHLQFCAQYPRLNPRLRPAGAAPPELSADERIQQHAMFSLVVDLFERAFLEFHDPDTLELIDEEKSDEWEGWEVYIDSYAAIPAFRDTWDRVGTEFDTRFQAWMEPRIAAARAK